MENACAFTGHRPNRLGYDQGSEQSRQLLEVLAQQIELQTKAGVTDFYTGMALGVDQWAALAILNLREIGYPNIRLIAVRPCPTQASKWTAAQRELYYDVILPAADDIVMISTRHTKECMFQHNRYLVDHTQNLIAVYDGDRGGGTAYTVKYAKRLGRNITIIQPTTLEVTVNGRPAPSAAHIIVSTDIQ